MTPENDKWMQEWQRAADEQIERYYELSFMRHYIARKDRERLDDKIKAEIEEMTK